MLPVCFFPHLNYVLFSKVFVEIVEKNRCFSIRLIFCVGLLLCGSKDEVTGGETACGNFFRGCVSK